MARAQGSEGFLAFFGGLSFSFGHEVGQPCWIFRGARPTGLGWPNDHAVLINPDDVWNVHDTEGAFEDVVGVDKGGVFWSGCVDVLAYGVGAVGFDSDSDDGDRCSGGAKLGVEGLPTWQVIAAASIGSPADEN